MPIIFAASSFADFDVYNLPEGHFWNSGFSPYVNEGIGYTSNPLGSNAPQAFANKVGRLPPRFWTQLYISSDYSGTTTAGSTNVLQVTVGTVLIRHGGGNHQLIIESLRTTGSQTDTIVSGNGYSGLTKIDIYQEWNEVDTYTVCRVYINGVFTAETTGNRGAYVPSRMMRVFFGVPPFTTSQSWSCVSGIIIDTQTTLPLTLHQAAVVEGPPRINEWDGNYEGLFTVPPLGDSFVRTTEVDKTMSIDLEPLELEEGYRAKAVIMSLTNTVYSETIKAVDLVYDEAVGGSLVEDEDNFSRPTQLVMTANPATAIQWSDFDLQHLNFDLVTRGEE